MSEKKKRGRPPAKKANARKVPPAEGVPADQLGNVTLIKRYANRRLYDTKRSKYVTMDDLVEVIARGEEIQVIDETSNEDVTKRVLTQVVLHEEESKNLNLLPLGFLKKLIQYRDEGLRDYFQRYMMQSLDAYMQAQKLMEQRMQGFTGMQPGQLTSMFPWMGMPGMMPGMMSSPPQQASTPPTPAPAAPQQNGGEPVADELAELRKRLADLETRYKK